MTTDIIDTSLHVATIPSTYTGPGTVVGNINSAGGVVSDLSGYFTSTGNATEIRIGFRPRWVKVINDTDSIIWEWVRGMAATHAIKMVITTLSFDTGSAIVPSEDAANSGNWKVTLSATLCGTSKNICFLVGG